MPGLCMVNKGTKAVREKALVSVRTALAADIRTGKLELATRLFLN